MELPARLRSFVLADCLDPDDPEWRLPSRLQHLCGGLMSQGSPRWGRAAPRKNHPPSRSMRRRTREGSTSARPSRAHVKRVQFSVASESMCNIDLQG